MRWKTLFPIFLIFLIYLAGIVIADTITGRASSQSTNISIAVISSVPLLNIISPLNGTYLTNESLYLNYTEIYAVSVWYNLDNSQNISLTSPIYFNTTEGPHILYLFANNSDNDITNKSRAFYINTTRLFLIYDEEKGATKGNSTDFIRYTLEQLQSLDNIILENTLFGKISFLEPINVTDDPDPDDNIINLDLYTNISYNRIEINTSENALKNFNKSAILSLYDLNFTNPRVLKDNETCPSSICTEIGYTNGTFTFRVTGFSVYSAEETPPAPPTIPSGKAKVTVPTVARIGLEFDKKEIRVSLVPGETKIESLAINNPFTISKALEISYPDLIDFLEIEETEFVLGAGQSQELVLTFKAKEDAIPGLYMGYIIFRSGSQEEVIFVAIEIESREKIIEVEIEMPASMIRIAQEKLIVYPGESLYFDVNLVNLEKTGKAEVLVEYFIKDDANKDIVYEKETLIVEESLKFMKELAVPVTQPGKYLLYVKATSKERVSSDSVFFEIKEKINIWIYIIILLIVIIILFVIKREKNKRGY